MSEELNPDKINEEVEKEEKKEIAVTVETVNYDTFKATLNKYFDDFSRLIRIYKAKDETIAMLSAEVTKYRQDFALQLVKPVCMSLITYREDSRKTLANLAQYAKDAENVKKYCEYLVSDLEEIMITYGLEKGGEVFTLNGVKLTDIVPRKKKLAEEETPAEEEKPEGGEDNLGGGFAKLSYSFDTLLQAIDDGKERVEKLLEDCNKADENLKKYVELAAGIEENYSDSILLPVYNRLASLYGELKIKVEELNENISEENKTELYREVLKFVVDETETILEEQQVNIISDPTNVYDLKTCKIVKVINTEEAELDKTVARRHSDCYMYDTKVLYPSKVEVYKYVPKKD